MQWIFKFSFTNMETPTLSSLAYFKNLNIIVWSTSGQNLLPINKSARHPLLESLSVWTINLIIIISILIKCYHAVRIYDICIYGF